MNRYALFLAGRYYERDFPLYRKLARSRIRVAVDGGYRYFARSKTFPHLLIGDLDSLGGIPAGLSSRTEVVVHPTRKDRTDTELALDHALKAGATEIDIIQPTIGDPDHFLANLYLLSRKIDSGRSKSVRLRLVGPRFEAFYLENGSHRFERAKDSTVSVIPVSASIKLSWTGTAYDVRRVLVKRGQTRSTRNRILSGRATVRVDGEAFLIRLAR
jgi:thiamine pyrophosphokinase